MNHTRRDTKPPKKRKEGYAMKTRAPLQYTEYFWVIRKLEVLRDLTQNFASLSTYGEGRQHEVLCEALDNVFDSITEQMEQVRAVSELSE